MEQCSFSKYCMLKMLHKKCPPPLWWFVLTWQQGCACVHGKVNPSMYHCVSLIPAHVLTEHECILIKVTFCSAVGINAGRSLLMSDDPAFHSLLIAPLPRKEILWLCLMSVDKVKNSFYVGATDVSRKMLFHQLVYACGLFVVRETVPLPNSTELSFCNEAN